MQRHALLRAALTDRGLLALGCGYLLVSAWLLFGTTPEPGRTTVFWAVQFPGDLLFFVSALYLTRHFRGDRRPHRFWRLFTLAAAAFMTADLLRTVEGLLGLETTEPGPVQLTCFAIGQTAIVVALAGFPMLIGAGAARHRFLLDAAIVFAGAGAIVWFLVTDPRAASASSSGVVSGLVIGAGVMLVGFLSVKLVLSGHSPVARPAAVTMITAGIVQVAQTAVLPIYAVPLSDGASLAVQLLPTVLIAAGPRMEVLRVRLDPTSRPGLRRRPYSLLPYAVVGIVQLLLFTALLVDPELNLRFHGMLVAMALTTALVVVRQLLSVSENARLIDELDRSLLEQRAQKEWFSSLVAHSSDLTLVLDEQNVITYASPAAERVLGLRPEQLVGVRLRDQMHVDDLERLGQGWATLQETPGKEWTVQVRLKTAERGWRWLETVNTNLLDVPSIRGIVSNCRDVTEARELQDQLRYQAEHDVLTQLANRRLFTERLAGAGDRVALLAIDLDGFKPINDTHGHHVGDAVLIAVAERIRRCVRPTDTAARLGGDEFAVLMPGATLDAAQRLAARIRGVLADPIAIGSLLLTIGASIGAAAGSAADPEALLRRADAEMYAVKRNSDATRSRMPATDGV
ncbi:sensor domain-containing diguanylate cyclase [Cryptosporangium aurantiacum]|uniref:PAS domain S-box-containing protein/diguanylate cyclase (GGDEF) domain-containing protein n=1 Tax=Cryptosporangium aurantiacum TaxID=134849 RepID=A0A1M7MAM7_9ACTN|nr:sensor domain-containing diguanylate cyclase [Cryptosporangium aurantiacum]SHM87874.1 PAS domain S-box-containing protein/diguanylate cyclase (GGDEF) domain-containing protein [Cryptosporangium aurantiacum]